MPRPTLRAGVTLLLALGTGCGNAPPAQSPATELRLTPEQLGATQGSEAVAPGTSAIAGIQTAFVKGDPKTPGVYTVMLRIPANTRIEAHDHPDDRVASVVSGTWYFGYGQQYDDSKLRALPAGSYYTEPPSVHHFARTGDTPVVLLITGYGPTGTRYVDGKDDPRVSSK